MKKYLDKQNLEKLINVEEIIIGLLLLLWFISRNFSLLVWMIVILNFHNITFSFLNLKRRMYFLFFNLTIFLFLVSRPFLDMLYNYKFYEKFTYNIENGTFALIAIGCSLLFLFIGLLLYEKFFKKEIYNQSTWNNFVRSPFVKKLQLIALILFLICFIFDLITGLERVLFIREHTYYEYHASFETRLPLFIKGISSMMPVSLIIYLATMPNKKNTIIFISLFVLSTLPKLMIGTRSAISEALVFSFLYFFLRDSINNEIKKERWITKPMKILIIISIPIIMASFSAINYVRFNSEKVNNMNPVVDFIYKQGVSYTVMTRSYNAIPHLPNAGGKNYTFGPFIDYITRGTPAQILFNAESLGAGNTEKKVFEGNNFAHAISYYLYGEKYFTGQGAGSSYIIELYADYGFAGIIVFSTLLGAFLGVVGNISIKRWLLNIILLRALMDIYFVPRASALGWLTFLLSPQYWLPIILCYLAAKYMPKKKFTLFNTR